MLNTIVSATFPAPNAKEVMPRRTARPVFHAGMINSKRRKK
jgi:hypothetical protein